MKKNRKLSQVQNPNTQGPQSPQPSRPALNQQEFNEKVKNRAYELYQRRGDRMGYAFDDWVTAEKQIKSEFKLR